MITYKFPELESQMPKVHRHLQEIIEVASFLAVTWYDDDLQVTAIYDPNHPGPTHRLNEIYHRFVDCSLLKAGRLQSERLRVTINTCYIYSENPDGSVDTARSHFQTIPPLDHEPLISTAPHFHFQIPPIWLSH